MWSPLIATMHKLIAFWGTAWTFEVDTFSELRELRLQPLLVLALEVRLGPGLHREPRTPDTPPDARPAIPTDLSIRRYYAW